MNTAEAIEKVNTKRIAIRENYTLKDHGEWRIPVKTLWGDCEDYVNAVAWYVAGESFWGMSSLIFSGKIKWVFLEFENGDKHLIGYDEKTDKYFDNSWRALYSMEEIQQAPNWKAATYHKPYSGWYVFRKLFWSMIRGGD